MTIHKDIVKALKDLGAKEYTLSGDNIDDIVWLSDVKFTKAQIENAIKNPLPESEPSIIDKLNQAGISLDELKKALGLG